jgi:hypothetical protein
MTPPRRPASCPRRSGSDPSKAVPPTRVSKAELRQRFAQGDYLNRALAGEFGCCLARTKRAQSKGEPPGTRSLGVSYVNELGHRIFLVHLYLRPDGTIGASGKPDPKWLFEDGIVYEAETT